MIRNPVTGAWRMVFQLRTQDDPVEEDVDDPTRDPDDNVIPNPAPPATEEYIDLEIARVQPPA